MAFDFTDLQGQRFQQDLQTASGYKPLLKKDLDEAYGRYKDVGVKAGRVKGKSDADLYKQATDDVLRWWKFNKEKAAKDAADAAAAAARAAAPRIVSGKTMAARRAAAGEVAAPRVVSGATMAARRAASMPDTAMGDGGTPSNLPTLQTRADPNYVRLELARAGFRGVVPPAYALTTVEAFNSWLAQQVQLRQGITGTSDPKISTPAPTTRTTTRKSSSGGSARTM